MSVIWIELLLYYIFCFYIIIVLLVYVSKQDVPDYISFHNSLKDIGGEPVVRDNAALEFVLQEEGRFNSGCY